MENDKNSLQNKLKDAAANEKKLSELIRKYASIQTETEKIKNQFQEKLKDREAKLIEDMNRQFKAFMREWKTTKNKKQLIERFNRQLEIKYSKLVPEKQKKDPAKKPAVDPALFKPGIKVKLNGGKATGTIESIDGNKARVLFGEFYTLCKLNDLDLA
jgi:DNA mismatch repair protein MutS2